VTERAAPAKGIDVVFASHDGARTLPRMLTALERMAAPDRPWRILAVDNASTDETTPLLRDAAARLPLTPLACATPGKMPAILSALPHLAGDLVVFTDDDVEPCSDWLRAYERAADGHPEAGFFGGPIIPTPLEPLEGWFEASSPHHAELFGRSDVADGPSHGEGFFGPNFLLRREHVAKLYEVPPRLGPVFGGASARTFAMGEDNAIMALLAESGVQGWGVADAEVGHLVRNFQTHLDFMLVRAERHGRGWAVRHLEGRGPVSARGAWIAALGGAAALARLANPQQASDRPDPNRFGRLWRQRWRMGAAREVLDTLRPGAEAPVHRQADPR
jgi:hypothetical protein